MATLTVRRRRTSFAKSRSLAVVVDGQTAATVRNGDTARIDLPAGRAEIVLRLDWTSSAPLSLVLDSDDEVSLEAAADWSCALWMFLRPRQALTLRRI